MLSLGLDPGISSPGICLIKFDKLVILEISFYRSNNPKRTLYDIVTKNKVSILSVETQLTKTYSVQIGWMEAFSLINESKFITVPPFSSVSKSLYKTTSNSNQRYHAKKRGSLAISKLIPFTTKLSSDMIDSFFVALAGVLYLNDDIKYTFNNIKNNLIFPEDIKISFN